MVGAQVAGNDVVISISNALGEFQLNTMLPVIAYNINQSIAILANASRLLAKNAIENFEVNEDRIAELILKNPIVAAILNPIIGYDKAGEVLKRALKENKSVKQVAVEMNYLTAEEADRILQPQNMTHPGLPEDGG